MSIYFQRIIRSAWQSFRRNGWLTLVAVIIMSQALLIVSILLSLNVVINASINAVNERIDVAIFFEDTVPEAQAQELRAQVSQYPEVRQVNYVSPEEALDKFLADNRNRGEIRDVISTEENFLPASLEIKADNPSQISGIVERIRASQLGGLISETSLEDNQRIIDRLESFSQFIRRSSLLLATVLMMIALLIIFNTIRITIYTRRTEIEIMRLVGATDWYIRWPFIIEGMIYGIVATGVSSLILLFGYQILVRPVVSQYLLVGQESPIFTAGFLVFLVVIQLLIGLFLGAISSYMATKRHLVI